MSRRPGLSPDSDPEQPQPWPRRYRDLAYIGWASFLMACAASAVFFAMIDPQMLSGTTTPGWEISRQAGYAIGFFGFWMLTAATSAFVIWLVRTENTIRIARRMRGDASPAGGRRRRGPFRRRSRHGAGPGREERP